VGLIIISLLTHVLIVMIIAVKRESVLSLPSSLAKRESRVLGYLPGLSLSLSLSDGFLV
jgi:hypothetical protein